MTIRYLYGKISVLCESLCAPIFRIRGQTSDRCTSSRTHSLTRHLTTLVVPPDLPPTGENVTLSSRTAWAICRSIWNTLYVCDSDAGKLYERGGLLSSVHMRLTDCSGKLEKDVIM